MQMLSYRGPNAAGGVSSALGQMFTRETGVNWWYLKDNQLCRHSTRAQQVISSFSNEVKDNHYRYCNNFLWPVLHDLPQFAHYSEYERRCYRAFNGVVAAQAQEIELDNDIWFINDYQFAIMPRLLQQDSDSLVFWHIPWPKNVLAEHVEPMTELALCLLCAQVIGFHTQEYVDNFFDFVEAHLDHFHVDRAMQSVSLKHGKNRGNGKTMFAVAPLGVDLGHWRRVVRETRQDFPIQLQTPIVLSVDRCDYTKGMLERFESIEMFLDMYPEWHENIQFVQIGARSRPGLLEFDNYWQRCRQQADAVNARFASSKWQPLRWIEDPVGTEGLAQLYSRADVMLVNPVRDGLNLTAKEFAACQQGIPGVLALSKSAGAWHELKRGCVSIDPTDKYSFAQSIRDCLLMSETEKYRRMHTLKHQLEENLLHEWWQKLLRLYVPRTTAVAEKVCS